MNKCSYCGTSYKDYLQNGFVGCEKCYYEIEGLKKLVDSIYENKRYIGKGGHI